MPVSKDEPAADDRVRLLRLLAVVPAGVRRGRRPRPAPGRKHADHWALFASMDPVVGCPGALRSQHSSPPREPGLHGSAQPVSAARRPLRTGSSVTGSPVGGACSATYCPHQKPAPRQKSRTTQVTPPPWLVTRDGPVVAQAGEGQANPVSGNCGPGTKDLEYAHPTIV
jgi:hypothetical protein